MSAPYKYENSKGVSYYLFKKEVELRGGRMQTIYFLSKSDTSEKGEPCDLPEDREPVENPKNGFVTLKKKKA